ncbi:MAG: hypothetical protein WAN81_08365 [Candidatus Binataceae bacterium]
MRPIKLIVTTVLFTMLALVASRADAQNGLGSSLDESATAAPSSKGPTEKGDSTLDSPTFQSSSELDEDYDKSGLNQRYDKSGLDEHYDKSGLDEHYDKSGLDEHYYKSESIK